MTEELPKSNSQESLDKTPGSQKRASLLFTQDNVITNVIQKDEIDFEAPLSRRETE